jgi:hypothetical protein
MHSSQIKDCQKNSYDKTSKQLSALSKGQVVRIQTPCGYDSKGVVKEVCSEPRSYIILSGEKEYRRNRRHLSVKEPMPNQYDDDDDHQVIHAPTKVNDLIPNIPPAITGQITSQTHAQLRASPNVTRYHLP